MDLMKADIKNRNGLEMKTQLIMDVVEMEMDEEPIEEEGEEEEVEICTMVALDLDTGVEVNHEFVNLLKIGRRVGQKKIGDIEGLFDNRVMSRNHAALHYREERFFLEDTNSSNGTQLNDQRLQPFQPTEVFSGDVLEFGTEVQTTSSHIRPLRIQVKLFQPDGRQAGEREDEVTEISKKDLAELLAILSEADTDLNSLEKKLMALEEVVKQCRQREIGGDFEKDCFLISKLTSIEVGVESIRQRIDKRGPEDKRDLHVAFRQVLEVVDKKEVRHVVGEEGEEYRLEPTGKLVVPKLKHSESAPNILVHETMPKSILRPPGSPRNGQIKRARTTSIPTEVWEIENCLVERDEEEWRQLEEESCMGRPPPRSASLETLVPSEDFSQSRRRKFTQIFDKSDPLNPTDLRRRLEQVSRPLKDPQTQEGKLGNEKQVDMEEKLMRKTSENLLDPLTEKLEDIAEKLDKERIESEAKWEKSQRELEEERM